MAQITLPESNLHAIQNQANTCQNNFISITIPNVSLPTSTIYPFQVVNMLPIQITNPLKPTERKLLKRPEPESSEIQQTCQLNLQDLKRFPFRKHRTSRSRVRLFTNSNTQSRPSISSEIQTEDSTVVNSVTLDENWIVTATGQTQEQKQITSQARNFLEQSLCLHKRPRRTAVVPLLRMNCTKRCNNSDTKP